MSWLEDKRFRRVAIFSPLLFLVVPGLDLKPCIIYLSMWYSVLFLFVFVLPVFLHMIRPGVENHIETLPILYMGFTTYYVIGAIFAIPEISKNSVRILNPLMGPLGQADLNNAWHATISKYAHLMSDWFPTGFAILLALFLMHASRALYFIHQLTSVRLKMTP